MLKRLKKLGPGLLFAGAAIGVSHLVQSTRAGADFGFGLLWALLLATFFKYPFFQFGPRYTLATGESLLDGYKRMGKGILIVYFALTFATMFTIQTAVTIVTASLASTVVYEFSPLIFFGHTISSIQLWTFIILIFCTLILIKGRYRFLDVLMKVIIIVLSISTVFAVSKSFSGNMDKLDLTQVLPEKTNLVFLIAFMGWMPAPLDISIWHSLWSIEKQKTDKQLNVKSSLFDFNVGYITTLFLGVSFLAMGAFVMYNTGNKLDTSAAGFSAQLINMYTESFGNWAFMLIGLAALTTMFSTTITTLDGSPRALEKTLELLSNKTSKLNYAFWIIVLLIGTLFIFFVLSSELGLLVQIATVISFLTAPFYAIANYRLMTLNHVPKMHRPSIYLHMLSWLGIIFLIGFGLWYLVNL